MRCFINFSFPMIYSIQVAVKIIFYKRIDEKYRTKLAVDFFRDLIKINCFPNYSPIVQTDRPGLFFQKNSKLYNQVEALNWPRRKKNVQLI